MIDPTQNAVEGWGGNLVQHLRIVALIWWPIPPTTAIPWRVDVRQITIINLALD